MGDWCILRMKGQSTLPVFRALAEAGYDVWTPIQIQSRRVPRSKSRVERPVPIMPTYVFARAARIRDLFEVSQTVGFSVFHHRDRVPLIADREIEGLRTAEERAKPRDRKRVFRVGERVRVPEGAFAGLEGIVEQSDGRHTLVCFGGRLSINVDSFLLRSSELGSGYPKREPLLQQLR
ncbi:MULTISPECIES: transcription termination/antitermination protein NusG [Edaphosphingomonas]|uniref:NusG-like N-terminal domain-containing protein n=2 Tax=Edaphosphingomonas TaxID=3423724 RepID=A0A2T4HVS4_9SPHN|nr:MULTISPECIES: transcription termination/antitermination NusG family protein [Sphingomonas]OHT19923.1 Transcription antitermination protein RfaH [Sphingomonas haloaromaticamans]PTD19914.1 hypothetical protein CV103_12045 [Sphingomonas fennica]